MDTDTCQPSDGLTTSPKMASSGGVFNANDGSGKLFLCSMYNTNPEPSIKIAINACLITFLLLKGLEHPISAGIAFDRRKGNSHYHLAVCP